MKVIKTKTGKVQLMPTLAYMEVGETWKISADKFSLAYIRVSVSNYGKAVNKKYTVNAQSGEKIVITRVQ